MRVGKVWPPISWISFRELDTWYFSGWKNRLERRQSISVQWRTLDVQERAIIFDHLALSSRLV